MAKKAKKKLKKKAHRSEFSPAVYAKKKKKAITHELLPTIPTMKTESVMTTGETLAGNYCNTANISHTNREFVLDFLFAFRDQKSLVSRVISSPQHVKEIYEVLGTNIKKYEERFGKI